jgi:Abortive infection alpha
MPDNDVTGPADTEGSPPRRPSPGIANRPTAVNAVARRPSPSIVRAGPGIARVAAVSAWNLVSWSLGATVAGANYVARRAVDGESAPVILQEAASELRNVAWRALGLPNEMVSSVTSSQRNSGREASAEDLQRRGSELLRRSNDVHVVEDTHPAFARILTEITPDEARILRFIYLEGPQPSIDIRTYRPLGIGSVLVAAGMSMIAEHAGLRNLDRIDPYLTNLARLGLIEFSKEQVSNPTRYQVIEAQPKVVAALKTAGRSPKLVQRSVRLTSFGEEFVRTCLPLNGKAVAQGNATPGPGGAAGT